MKIKPEKNYEEWLIKINEDELSGRALLKEKSGAPSTVCFLSQQMAEKCLKMLLVYNKQDFPKIHDLLALESLILKIAPKIKNHEDELDVLSSYYIETRYPGDFPEFSWNDAKEALEAAENIKVFVLNEIK